MGAGQLLDPPDLVGHAGRLAIQLDDEHGGGVGRVARVHEGLDGLHHPLVHHLEGRRDHPRGDDGTDRLCSRTDAHEVEEQGRHIRRILGEAHADPRRYPEGSLPAHERPAQVVAHRVALLLSQHHDLSIRQDHLHGENVGAGHPIQQAVRAPGVVGHVPPDRAGLLAGGIRGEVEAGPRQVAAEVQVHDPRFHPGQSPGHVHLQDPVHPGEHHHDRLVAGHRPTSQPGTGTTGHEIPPMCQRSHHARRYLFGRLRKADHPGLPTTDHRGIAAVEPTGPITHLDPLRVKGRDEGANQGIP